MPRINRHGNGKTESVIEPYYGKDESIKDRVIEFEQVLEDLDSGRNASRETSTRIVNRQVLGKFPGNLTPSKARTSSTIPKERRQAALPL